MRPWCLVLLLACVCDGSNITRVVLLMMENRSFSHMFGILSGEVSGKEYNRVNSSDPNSQKIFIQKNPPYVLNCDADHGLPATTAKIFGLEYEKLYGPGFTGTPRMDGFVEWELDELKRNSSLNYCSVMTAYTPDKLPVASFLAKEYALFSRYFCSLPGPTWPNRLFALSGTSVGLTGTGPWFQNQAGVLFPQETIGEQLERLGKTYNMYYVDTPWEMMMRGVIHNPDRLRNFEQFKEDAAKGTLPNFSWMWPQLCVNVNTGLGASDQHPNHDIALGEQLLKDVYEAVRASPQWNETLLLITYDEHGGFWDAAPPPQDKVPPPDAYASYPDKGFKFDRLGVRVPLIAISPWIPRGTMVADPPAAQKPFPTSAYDHTSMMSTTRKLLGVGNNFLTNRDRWAATFEHIFNMTEPRSDCPMKAPPAPTPAHSLRDNAELEINDLQRVVLEVHDRFDTQEKKKTQVRTREGHLKFSESFARIHSDMKSMKDQLQVYFAPEQNGQMDKRLVEDAWDLVQGRIQTRNLHVAKGVHLCLAWNGVINSTVAVAACQPNAPSQLLSIQNDFSIRPLSNASLCLQALPPVNATETSFGYHPMTVVPCVNDVFQHFSYSGVAPGNDPSGNLFWGTGYLGVYDMTK